MSPIRLEVVTAERLTYSDDVDVVVAPGVEGELGILPHHAPLMTMLQPGELRIKKAVRLLEEKRQVKVVQGESGDIFV